MRKLERILRVAALVSSLFAFWALGLNQLSTWYRASQINQVVYNEALMGCIKHGAPIVLFVNDEPYCSMTYQGTDFIAPLQKLNEANP